MFQSDDLIGIGMEADAIRRKLHPDGVVSYIIDRNINYTNFCTEYCSFCAFYRPMGHKEGYILPARPSSRRFRRPSISAARACSIQGGLHPDLKIEWYEDLLRAIKAKFDIWCHCFSAPEITNIAEVSGLSPPRHDRPSARRRAGFDPRRRRRDSGRRRALPNQPSEVRHQRVDRRTPHGPCARHAHHGDHDVRLRRNHRTAHEPLRHRAADSGGHGRIHGVYPVGLPARELPRWAGSSRKKPRRSNT